MSDPAVTIDGPRLRQVFDSWGPEGYAAFLRTKKLPEYELTYDWELDTYTLTAPARFAHILDPKGGGAQTDQDNAGLASHLWDYQSFIVRSALEARRYAIWADTGLGKTAMFLEWARHVISRTAARVLIFSPLNVIAQTCEEATRFYGDSLTLEVLGSRAHMREWCTQSPPAVGIVNYEKMIPQRSPGAQDPGEVLPELRYLGGAVLDEASILKTGGGRIKWALVKSCRGIEYKLACTATPAPNEVMEYASQASFLEKLRSEGEILWTWFQHDKFGAWRLRPHAETDFYRFMACWSVYLRSPARYGFADNLKNLPAPTVKTYQLKPTPEQRDRAIAVPGDDGQAILFRGERMGITQRSKYSQLAKGFLYDRQSNGHKTVLRVPSPKPAFVAELVRKELRARRQVLVWTIFDEESDIICEELAAERDAGRLAAISGAVPMKRRIEILERFRKGALRVLVTKASLLGHGMNLQHCTAMIFSGFDDSFERFYQAVRRCYRYGQKRKVRVHIPFIPELEGAVWENVQGKQAAFERDTAIMERCYLQALKDLGHKEA